MFLLNQNNIPMIKFLVSNFKEQINVNKADEKNVNLLMRAIAMGNDEIFKEIISNFQSKVDINQIDINGNTALHWATYKHNLAYFEIIVEKFKNQLDVSICNNKGRNVLMTVCEEGFFEALIILMKYFKAQIDINKKDTSSQHNSAVALAMQKGHSKIVTYLLKEFKGEIVYTGFMQSNKMGIGLVDIKF